MVKNVLSKRCDNQEFLSFHVFHDEGSRCGRVQRLPAYQGSGRVQPAGGHVDAHAAHGS